MKNLVIMLITLAVACNTTKNGNPLADESQTATNKQITVAFYNVENLYDTQNDPNTNDDEFTPESEKKWDDAKYQKKLTDLASVIFAIDSVNIPAIVGFAEVENAQVLADLAKVEKLQKANFQVVLNEGVDVRGIDVGLIYNPAIFKYISHEAIPVTLAAEPNFKTRDILHVVGLVAESDTLHVFVNHWSSRREGEAESEYKRVNAAQLLKNKVDELMLKNKNAKIVIMGDMNDEPQNISLNQTLKAGNNKNATEGELYNLMFDMDMQNKGSYSYKGNWNMLDNLIVSYSLIDSPKGVSTTFDAGKIYDNERIMYKNQKGELSPNRTYGGNKYFGGFSDHLPVYFTLKVK